MNVEEIRKRTRNGFTPFTIYLSDGRTYEVPHPEFILVTKRTVAIADKDGFVDMLDPIHIVSLKNLPTAKSGKH